MEHTDQELLGRYRQTGDRDALQELIRRHLDLVYSAALRLVRDRHLADDVTQVVFIIFAQRAASLSPATVPAGWLYRTTRYAALNAMKSKSRRDSYERLASRPERVEDSPTVDWEELAPHVDQALGHLRSSYRDAILLRFFRGMSLAAVGESLGVSEEAARKLVDRGVSQLREQLAHVNVSCSDAGLMTVLAAGAVHAAPAQLAQLVLTTAAAGIGAGAGTSASAAGLSPLIKGTIVMMTWTKTNITIAAVAAVLLIGGGATTIAYTAGAFSSSQQEPMPPAPAAAATATPPAPPAITSGRADPATTAEVRKTMSAVMATTVSADPEAMKALSYVSGTQHAELAQAATDVIVVGKRLRDAATAKFGPITPLLEGSLPGGPAQFREKYIPTAPVTMRGELAVVPIDPGSTPPAMAFRKVDGQWRMDLVATFAPTPEIGKRYLATLQRLTFIYEELIKQIDSGECASQQEAADTITQEMRSVR